MKVVFPHSPLPHGRIISYSLFMLFFSRSALAPTDIREIREGVVHKPVRLMAKGECGLGEVLPRHQSEQPIGSTKERPQIAKLDRGLENKHSGEHRNISYTILSRSEGRSCSERKITDLVANSHQQR